MNVVGISKTDINHELIQQLEEMLILAKTGELRSCLIVSEYIGEVTTWGWTFSEFTSKRHFLGSVKLAADDLSNNILLNIAGSSTAQILIGDE